MCMQKLQIPLQIVAKAGIDPIFVIGESEKGGNPLRIEIVFCSAIVRLHREMSPGATSLRPLVWPLSCLDP